MEVKKEKVGFLTENEAREELFRIINTNYNCVPARNKKPSRYYYSEEKELWYLTSQPKIYSYK